MPQHASSEVTVRYNTIRFKCLRERLEPNYDNNARISKACWKIHKRLKLPVFTLILSIFYLNDVYEQLKTTSRTIFCSELVLGFVIDYAFAWSGIYMSAKLVNKFMEFGYLNSCCNRQKYHFIVFELLERYMYAFVAKLSDRCFC